MRQLLTESAVLVAIAGALGLLGAAWGIDAVHAFGAGRIPRLDEVTLDALGSFGGDKPRALFARVAPSKALTELQADIERQMRRIGLPAEGRKFVPHVTLARLRDTTPVELAHFLSLHPIVRPITFTARRVALMSSRDSIGGGPYVLEAAYPLGPSYPNRLPREVQRR